MSSALGLRRAALASSRNSRVLGGQAQRLGPSVCLFCSLAGNRTVASTATTTKTSLRSRRLPSLTASLRRHQSTQISSAEPTQQPETIVIQDPTAPRRELEQALLDVESHAANYVNLARVQLALRNLKQQPGHESIRVAFLGLANDVESKHTAKKLLRLALADPLKPKEDWEDQLEAHDVSKPLILRIDVPRPEEEVVERLSLEKDHVIPELRVPSPTLGGANLEMLVKEIDPSGIANASEQHTFGDAVLVPTIDSATTTAGHMAPITSPVHMALLVGDGIKGAATVLSLPMLEESGIISTAVNFSKLAPEDMTDCPFEKVNVEAGNEGLELFRDSVRNARQFEALSTEANVGHIRDWLKRNVVPTDDGTTKPPVRHLIQSLLSNAHAALQAEEARDVSLASTAGRSPGVISRLDSALADWAQTAHEELESQLDVAFTSEAWRKLNWWKLFWRVDDVGMLSSEMIALRFLPDAERGIIFLAGRLREAGVAVEEDGIPAYSGPTLPLLPAAEDGKKKTTTTVTTTYNNQIKWPAHIPYTRNYLQEKTVPALQALAQKLTIHSFTTSGLSVVLGGLCYASSLGAYECGAIAALGIVLSLRHLQTKWETARAFWEGEVREEGRKAVRASEGAIAEVLDEAVQSKGDLVVQVGELRKARDAIRRAEEALARLK